MMAKPRMRNKRIIQEFRSFLTQYDKKEEAKASSFFLKYVDNNDTVSKGFLFFETLRREKKLS